MRPPFRAPAGGLFNLTWVSEKQQTSAALWLNCCFKRPQKKVRKTDRKWLQASALLKRQVCGGVNAAQAAVPEVVNGVFTLKKKRAAPRAILGLRRLLCFYKQVAFDRGFSPTVRPTSSHAPAGAFCLCYQSELAVKKTKTKRFPCPATFHILSFYQLCTRRTKTRVCMCTVHVADLQLIAPPGTR